MKFQYEYYTALKERRRGEIIADSRETAFARIKAKGFKPFNLVEAPGLLNKFLAHKKWWVAVGTLLVVAVIAIGVVIRMRQTVAALKPHAAQPRHQIYGDPALLESIARNHYRSVFASAGDRVLAKFAQPGVVVRHEAQAVIDEWADALSELEHLPTPHINEVDVREVVELKQIVCWMRAELSRYLLKGKGTTHTYIRRLYERQDREFMIYSNAVADIQREKDPVRQEKINQSLRRMGLRTVLVQPTFGEED